jgi:phosphoserine phosphatase RsbU/P
MPFEHDCTQSPDYLALEQNTSTLLDLSGQIMARKPLAELLGDIIESSKHLLQAEAASLLLYNPEEEKLYFHVVDGGRADIIRQRSVDIGQGMAGWVAQHRETLHLPDCHADPRFNAEFDKQTGFRTRNMVCTPMVDRNRLVGVLQVMNKSDGGNFSEQDVRFLEYLAAQCAIAIENNRLVSVEIESEQISAELNTARKIQQKTLPSHLPEIPGVGIDFRLIPARQLGGDYYNVVDLGGSRYLFLMADVSGKSVSAALIVASVYSFLQTYLIVQGGRFELKDFVESLNTFLCQSTTSDKFVTAWFGLFDADSRTLVSISAGHEPCYLYRCGSAKPEVLSAGGLLLGMMSMPYQFEQVVLEPGDMLLCYTDGVTEAMSETDEEFGADRMLQAVGIAVEAPDDGTPVCRRAVDAILYDIKLHRGAQIQSDDITLGVICIGR